MKTLAPSILSADFGNLAQQIRMVEMGGADWIHCDIMDGKFVPNLSFGPLVVEAVRKITKLPIDSHLMIQRPDDLIEEFINAGCNYITVHQEEVVHLHRTVTRIKELGAKAGVAINPATPLDSLVEILPFVEMILIMSVNPGFGGQSFIETSLTKIRTLKEIKETFDYDFLIEVDGGLNNKNIKEISEAGCDVFVVGSSIFSSDNITSSALELKNLISQ